MAEFTDRQRAQLARRGIDEGEALRQLTLLRRGPEFVDLARPCAIGDGVETVPEDEQEQRVLLHDRAARQGRWSKLVPASGAATRMFEGVLSGRDVPAFLAALERFPFVDDLRAELAFRGYDLDVLRGADSADEILDALLGSDGLGLAAMPKGLIPFHRGRERARTALEEHLAESAATVADARGSCRVHFTVSPEHLESFRRHAEVAVPEAERRLGVLIEAGFSTQKPSTDTIAASPDGSPLVTDDGDLVLRPAGHGALLDNLADLGGDLVLVKNVDNVQPEGWRADTIRWKKILGGTLVAAQSELHLNVARLRDPGAAAELVAEAEAFAARRFGIELEPSGVPPDARRRALLAALDRPLRVCGVVRNTGEPGGGPFWVRDREGRTTRQIVESAQVDPASESQRAILRRATHFNPVDLACGLRDAAGAPFDLRRFVAPETSIVARKSHAGREILALERPGLWNGAMAGWLTLFVEVPIGTFTPVKTVMDLLRPEHQM